MPEGSRSENRMDDPRVFGEFLDWGIANYPAERYALLLFDHGGSFYGFGGDDQDGLGGANALKPRAFRKEIQRSLDIAGVEKFDFINFFACLMGATEVLDAFDGLCDVFYGNPEIAWYYHIRGRLKYIDILLNNKKHWFEQKVNFFIFLSFIFLAASLSVLWKCLQSFL